MELEIGMGKGTFLTEQARARPNVNFFGIEWARWFWRYASDRLRRNGCTNARTVRAEAGYFLTEFVPAGSISVLHIYFPDPWPKTRDRKCRLIQPPFLLQVQQALVPGWTSADRDRSQGVFRGAPSAIELQKEHTVVMAQQDELQTQLQQIKAQRQEIDGLERQLQQQNASLQERLQRLESYVATQMKIAFDVQPATPASLAIRSNSELICGDGTQPSEFRHHYCQQLR